MPSGTSSSAAIAFSRLRSTGVGDLAGNAAAARRVRHQHRIAAGERQVGGERRALVAALLLDDLHEQHLAALDHFLDLVLARARLAALRHLLQRILGADALDRSRLFARCVAARRRFVSRLRLGRSVGGLRWRDSRSRRGLGERSLGSRGSSRRRPARLGLRRRPATRRRASAASAPLVSRRVARRRAARFLGRLLGVSRACSCSSA